MSQVRFSSQKKVPVLKTSLQKTWGETVTVGLNTNDKGVFEVNASGIIPAQALKQVIPVESLAALSTKYLSGLAPFALKGEITSNKVNIHVDSSLNGFSRKTARAVQ